MAAYIKTNYSIFELTPIYKYIKSTAVEILKYKGNKFFRGSLAQLFLLHLGRSAFFKFNYAFNARGKFPSSKIKNSS